MAPAPEVAPQVMTYTEGVTTMRFTRIMVADGMSDDEILREHPSLEPEDIREALRYAAEAVRERMIPLEA